MMPGLASYSESCRRAVGMASRWAGPGLRVYSRGPEIASTAESRAVRQPMLAILRMLAISDGQQTQAGQPLILL
jgi:hypothetical protein